MVETDRYRPKFSEGEVCRIAEHLFGVRGTLRSLPSERDQNFRLQTDSSRYVLKIHAADERDEVLDLQNQLMLHVAEQAPELLCPRVILNQEGSATSSAIDSNGRSFAVRLLSYLPGKPLARICHRPPALHEELGRFFGRLDEVLRGFQHAAAPTDFYWDLRNAGATITQHVKFIHSAARRDSIESLLSNLKNGLQEELDALQRSIIHNDGNDYNILVDASPAEGALRVGVIDFGDVVHSATISDLAVMSAYVLMDRDDPLQTLEHLMAGYREHRTVTEEEIRLLPDLIQLRLALSVTLSAYRKTLEPDNEYLTISERPAWLLLERLGTLPRPLIEETLLRAGQGECSLGGVTAPALRPNREGVPHAPLANWFRRQQLSDWKPIDLSVQSTHLNAAVLTGDATPREALPSRLDAHFAPWGEARILSPESGTAGEPIVATMGRVHLGIDLFSQAQEEVVAPTAGRVLAVGTHSIQFQPEGAKQGSWILRHLEAAPELTTGSRVAAGESLGQLCDAADWPPHLHIQWVATSLALDEIPGACRPSHRPAWQQLCPDPTAALGLPQHSKQGRLPGDLIRRRERHLGTAMSLSYREPLTFVRGYGCYLADPDGNSYLDLVNNVCHVGHAHHEVVAAGAAQMAALNTNTRYLHPTIVRYAEQLLATFPAELDVCYFVCTGSEANELALRMCRAHTGGDQLISVETGYHGNTQATIDISSYKFDGPGGKGAPPFVHVVPAPDPYRGIHPSTEKELGHYYAGYVGQAADHAHVEGGLAAFICESILSCGGQVVLPEGYLSAAYAHVRALGGLCIADEVQVGFGRAGSHFWAFETQAVVPDVVTLGKPIGNGHPIAAVITRREIAESFANGMEFFNTFGGNPVSCAMAEGVLNILQRDQLQQHAAHMGDLFLAGLRTLKEKHPVIGDVRGLGLFLGIEFVTDPESKTPDPRLTAEVAEHMKARGILISVDGPLYNVLKIKPPMVIQQQEISRVVEALGQILSGLSA